jgi:hypothetical protein
VAQKSPDFWLVRPLQRGRLAGQNKRTSPEMAQMQRKVRGPREI